MAVRPQTTRFLLVCGLLFTGCQSRVVDLSMTLTGASPSFVADVGPILTTKCTPCHIGNRTSGVEMTTYALLTTSVGDQYGELVVQPGAAADSPIINKISSDNPMHGARMPRDSAPLSSAEIETIRNWIDDGARDN